MEKTTYREANIYVTDNGYTIRFSDYKGTMAGTQGLKVAKTLEEVKKILEANFYKLVD